MTRLQLHRVIRHVQSVSFLLQQITDCGGLLSATRGLEVDHGKQGTLATLNEFLRDVEHHGLPTTRVLVIEGSEGVGKSYVIEAAAKLAGQHGFGVIGPIDGRDLAGCPSCWNPNCRSWEPLRGNELLSIDPTLPLLVAIDDGHLANPDRLETEMRWLRKINRSALVWVISTRRLTRLTADNVAVVSLSDLPEKAVIELVTEMLGAPPAPELAEFVAQAGGNPRLAKELVLGLREEARLRTTDGVVGVLHTSVPLRISRLVRQRLNTVSPQCRRTLQVAAMLGRRMGLSTVAEAVATPVARLIPQIDEASEAGLVNCAGSHFSFRNKLIWRVTRATVPLCLRQAVRQEAEACRQTELWSSLSEREQTIARFAGSGLTNQQIAHRVFLSPHTVNYYLRRIFQKLNVRSRIELAKLTADADVLTDAEAN